LISSLINSFEGMDLNEAFHVEKNGKGGQMKVDIEKYFKG